MSDNLYDLSILSEMVYGDTEFMQELINTFIEHAPIDSQELVQYASEGNWDETSKKAHKLKSSIRTLGVTSLSDIILRIEMDAKTGKNADAILSNIQKFASTLEKVIKNLKNEKF